MTRSPVLGQPLPPPDLASGVVVDPPASANQLDNVSLPYDIFNNGPGAASASTLGYYLPPVPYLSAESIKLVGSPAVINLPSGAGSPGWATELIPGSTPSGAYYLVVCANDTHAVLESTMSNNCAASGLTIQIGVGTQNGESRTQHQ